MQTKEPSASETMLASVSRQLAAIEKRDWELWLIVIGTGTVVAGGLLVALFPSVVMRDGSIRLELNVSKELFYVLICLLILFNTYVVTRRVEFRRTRQELISATMQNELIRLQSFTDPLTEVYNRRSLEQIAAREIARAKRLQSPLTLLLLDVDQFKQVNTKFGHITGDVVLAEIASLLKGCVRGSDTVIRYGGDEFLVFLPDSNRTSCEVVVARINQAALAWNLTGHLPGFALRLSIGISEWEEGKTLDETLEEADRQMFEEKPGSCPSVTQN
jgi:diguanylate cyclase (GGDEF)-like protein